MLDDDDERLIGRWPKGGGGGFAEYPGTKQTLPRSSGANTEKLQVGIFDVLRKNALLDIATRPPGFILSTTCWGWFVVHGTCELVVFAFTTMKPWRG